MTDATMPPKYLKYSKSTTLRAGKLKYSHFFF